MFVPSAQATAVMRRCCFVKSSNYFTPSTTHTLIATIGVQATLSAILPFCSNKAYGPQPAKYMQRTSFQAVKQTEMSGAYTLKPHLRARPAERLGSSLRQRDAHGASVGNKPNAGTWATLSLPKQRVAVFPFGREGWAAQTCHSNRNEYFHIS